MALYTSVHFDRILTVLVALLRVESWGVLCEDVRSGAEEEDHTEVWLAFAPWTVKCEDVHECMWEAHFGPVDDAIPYTFHQCEDVMVLWVKHNLLQRRLPNISDWTSSLLWRLLTSSACNLSMSRSQRQAPLSLGTRR